MKLILMALTAVLTSLLLLQGCISKGKANQQTHQTNKQRALRVFSFGVFRANAFLLKPGIAITNKHVCDMPDFVLVNNEGVAQAPIDIKSSKDYDVCVVTLDKNPRFDYSLLPLILYTEKLPLNLNVEILGYSLRQRLPEAVLLRSSGVSVEIVDYVSGQDKALNESLDYSEFISYFHDNVMSTLPIVPGCSGSPVYSSDGSLVGIANAVTSDGYGLFVQSSNLVKFLNEVGVDYARTDSISK
jgi:hypothetical protein